MKRILIILILAFPGVVFLIPARAQKQYTDYKTMVQKTDGLAKRYPSLCTVRSLVKTAGGKEIMVLSIGRDNKDSKPGIAVMGGIEGSYIVGRELAIGFASSLLNESESPEIQELLGKVTFYIFPDVSPDASEQFFQGLKYERNINARSTDDDRDFLVDEDPCEDLNNDGFITLIRVSDPAGTYTEAPEDKRIMIPADLSKGQRGTYLVHSEGTDNDKDGKFNEDGQGGVNFNRNLTYNYEEFGTNAGLHPVSEPETKAVLDFLFEHYNIYATIAFGPQDNLGQDQRQTERKGTPDPQASGSDQRQPQPVNNERKFTNILRSDEIINKLVSEEYHKITGIKDSPPVKSSPGNFMDWSYFHYGRYSYSTPGWWFNVEKDTNAEVSFLKYAAENKMDDVFVPWTEINHPDFPGKKTETGGIKPFVMINPPADKLEDLVAGHYRFIKTIAAMHPELEFLDVNVEDKGENIYRLTLKVHNKGIFATSTEAGASNMWTRIMRLNLETSKNQKFLSGQPIQRISRLEGGSSAEFSWLIMGKGSVKITAGAVNTGTVSTSVELK